MTTVAAKTSFYHLAVLLDKIQKLTGTDQKKKLLKEFIVEWRKFHSSLHADDPNTKDSFYPVMRLLLPQLEREREAYGIKEVMLAKLYIDILGLGQGSPAAEKLKNFRGPRNNKSDMGDFANTAFWILKPRCPEKGTMTIEEVNNHLDNISQCNADKNKEGVKKALLVMLRNMSAREQKWLIRMILKDLKLGISQQSVFSVFHEDAEDLFNVKMSLEKVCTMLKDPNVRLHEIEIALFSPYRPMLGDRGAPSKVEKLMDGRNYIIETKFDGERMQLHKKGQEYKFFSRSGNDYTHVFGADPYSGTFTPAIYNCFKPHVQNVILDGEMVGYNEETKTIGSKGQNFDIKSLNPDEYQPMLCVFDVLLLNDEVLSNKPLKERKLVLQDIFEPMEGRIMLSETKMGRTNQDCADALNDAIDGREEGIMVKDPESAYKPNTRKGGWYKIKPEYVGGLMDELDVLVVGGYFGKGHRATLLSHFLCAVAVPEPGGDKPRRFHSFCRVGSGYTRKELYDFNDKLKPHFQIYNPKKPPGWLELLAGRQRPEIIIEPSKSYILQIKAAEITASDQYKTECTLRFPRVEKIRMDKNWFDCMTTDDIKELREKSEGKLTGRYVDIDDGEEEPAKKRKKMTTRHVKPTVMSAYRGADITGVEKVSELFAGREICVINAPSANPKATLEKKIVECGGTFVQNPGEDTFCVLADKSGLKVKNIIKKGLYDVVKVSWLLKCLDNNRFIPWVPSDMIYTSPKTEKAFSADYDCYGDSYYKDTTEEELRKVFDRVEKESAGIKVPTEAIADIEMRYFPEDATAGIFRLCWVYMDTNLEINEDGTSIECCPLEVQRLDLRLHGATILNRVCDTISHVIVHSSDLSRVNEFRAMNRKRQQKFHILTSDWVDDCIAEGKLLTERPYEAPSQ